MSEHQLIAAAIFGVFLVAGLWATVMGRRAYQGRWRSWQRIHPPLTLLGPHWGLLTLLVLGASSVLGGGLLAWAHATGSSELQLVALAVLIAGYLLGLAASHRLPTAWRPQWYRQVTGVSGDS